MTKEELEERIKTGERFFIIYSNDLRQLRIDLSDHNTDYTRCIPHLEKSEYANSFTTTRPFPILIEYTDNNEFEIVGTEDKINTLDSEEGETFLTTIKIGEKLDMSIAFSYVRSILETLSEHPLAIEITNIKSLDSLSPWEMAEILTNQELTKKQKELIEKIKTHLIIIYKDLLNNYKLIIKEGHQKVREAHSAEIKRQLYIQETKEKFNEFVASLYAPKPKVKTLRRPE